MSDRRPGPWVGIDIGGTGTRAVVVDGRGEVLAGATVSTGSFDADAVAQLADLVRSLLDGLTVPAGIGIGASGPVDLSTGRVDNPNTLPQFTDLDLAGGLQGALGAATWIDNDAVVAGLAETAWGSLPDDGPLLCVTLGTGIGAVLIEAGQPRRASDGQHPEAGHIPVPGSGSRCYCGLAQCWEQVASRTALDRLMADGGFDEGALWSEYAERLASGLITLVTIHHPAHIVVGGSVSRHWSRLETPLREAMSRFREFDPATTFVASRLGERAGALGAALLPQRGIGWHRAHLNQTSGPGSWE